MKIGIVTVFDSNNYGSFLQAYSMKIILNDFGHDVFFLETRDKKYVRRLFYNTRILFLGLLKFGIKGIARYFYYRKKYKIFKAGAEREFKTITLEKAQELDLIILGSDEIWNLKNRVFDNDVFFGNGYNNVAAFSISVGSSNLNDFINRQNRIKQLMKINFIFPRDANTSSILFEITKKKFEIVCDPTIMIDKKYLYLNNDLQINSNYILIYSYGLDSNTIQNIRKFAKKHNLLVVSAGFYYKWTDLNINLEPLQFPNICKKASYIVTSTFHGTIFSILSCTPFVSIDNNSRNKILDLLSNFSLSDRYLNNDSSYNIFEEKLLSTIDAKDIDERISNFKKTSFLCLNSMINCVRENNGKKEYL